MVKLLTVMYIICSVYSSNPQATEPHLIESLNREMLAQSVLQAPNIPTIIPEEQIDASNLDYEAELKKLGYYSGENVADELKLRNAVLRFQSDHNLIVDGIWGKKSLSALIKRLTEQAFSYPDTIESSPSEGSWAVINKSKRILTLYDNKTVTKKYPIAIGYPSSLTPSGKYTIVSKITNPSWGGGGYAKPVNGGVPENPLGYRWMGLSIKDGTRYGIHGNNSPYSIGKDISHGCVRMINSDVESLFEIIPMHMHVWIGTEEELLEWGINQKSYID
jgi:lipoprotein-anchoring transpeptidase ErfK/SrfK